MVVCNYYTSVVKKNPSQLKDVKNEEKSVPYSTIAWLSNTKYSCDTIIMEEKKGLGL